jgi:Ras-related protein Rab-7A
MTAENSIKIVVVGETGVGKTAIIQRFTDSNFTEDFKATVGADFSSHWVDVPVECAHSLTRASMFEGGSGRGFRDSLAALERPASGGKTRRVQLQIWDTAGQERYRSLSLSYFKGCEAAMVVFDVCSADSYSKLSHWLDEVLRGTGRQSLDGFPVFIVGNKIDHPVGQHAISTEEATQVMMQRGLPYMTCSAKTGQHVDSIFRALALQALDERAVMKEERATSVKLSSSAVGKVRPPRPVGKEDDCAC